MFSNTEINVDEASEGRLALNLSKGVSVDDLSRGSVIVLPNSILTTQIIDVAYTHLDGATPPKPEVVYDCISAQ